MTSPLQQSADIITRAAGWKKASPDTNGTFRFSLEGGLDFEMFSPENKTGILFAVIKEIQEGGASLTDDELQRLGALAAGSLKKRRSICSLGQQGIELYRTFPLQGTSDQTLLTEVQDFLNDLAWWKQQLARSGATPSSKTSPFSFSFDGWSSAGSFQR